MTFDKINGSGCLPSIALGKAALFLDLDGTLADLAAEPHLVHVDERTRSVIVDLSKRLNGALAIISGRSIADVDQVLSPIMLPVAGVHGSMRRDGSGRLTATNFDPGLIAQVSAQIKKSFGEHGGILIETKPGAVALHFRARPELGPICHDILTQFAVSAPGLRIQTGKMVVELLSQGVNKGTAILAFMAEPPFLQRTAVFAGDDATDEDGFEAVNSIGGLSIKIGDGDTKARVRFDSPEQFRDWLAAQAESQPV